MDAGRFEHPEKAATLVNIMGQQVLQEYRKAPEKSLNRCWAQYFEKPGQSSQSLQQLFAGLGLLLNFQFGMATKEVLKQEELESFDNDGQLLLDAIRKGFVQDYNAFRKSRPLARLLSLTGAVSDYHFGHFSVRKAMQHAWVAAARLVKSHPAELPKKVQDLDNYVVVLNRLIYEPGVLIALISRVI